MLRPAVASVAAIIGLFGCSPAIVPRDEFLRRGNAICAQTAGRLAELAGPRRTSSPEVVAGWVDAYVAEVRQEISDLRLLGYPRGQRRALDRAYKAMDAALASAEQDPLSFRPSTLAPAESRVAAEGLSACRPG